MITAGLRRDNHHEATFCRLSNGLVKKAFQEGVCSSIYAVYAGCLGAEEFPACPRGRGSRPQEPCPFGKGFNKRGAGYMDGILESSDTSHRRKSRYSHLEAGGTRQHSRKRLLSAELGRAGFCECDRSGGDTGEESGAHCLARTGLKRWYK